MAEDNARDPRGIRRAAAGVMTLPVRWPVRSAGAALDLRGWVARAVNQEVEHRRLFPWVAVSFGLGILLFFQAEGQPTLWASVSCLVVFAAAAFVARRHLLVMAVMIGFAALFAGFTAAAIRTRSVEAPVLARTLIGPLSGFIEAVEDREGSVRLTLRVTAMDPLNEADRPRRVRVTVRDRSGLAAGQHVSGTARLLPPPQPAWPGGYDFARDAYFREIGAVGSIVGRIAHTPPPLSPSWRLRLAASVDEARNVLTGRIAQAIGGPAGAVAAALVTGKRGLIDEPTNDVLRAAGIYHIVSISGLHMVLAAGTFFWLARALLALVPAAVLLWPVKRIAALVAMVGASAYCVFSGSEVATERSLIMTLVMFGAVLVDRPALSVRNLAIAALLVLAREPESLLGPSFQMSFSAVAALTALAPWLQGRAREGLPPSPAGRAVIWVGRSLMALLATTLVASLATAPFGVYHFQTVNPFGLIGNALALPLVSLAVMPAALLGVIAYPFGLDRPVWQVMGFAVAQVLEISGFVSGFSGSNLVVPALGVGALAAFSLALLLTTLPASALRWAAAVPVGAGVALAAAPERYDALVDRVGAGAAIRGAAGRFVIVGQPSAFVVEQWLRADGDARPAHDRSLREGSRCDPLGCVVVRADGRSVAFVQDARAFEEDCRRAAVVITSLSAPAGCRAALVLDRNVLRDRGAAAFRFEGGAVRLRMARPPDAPPPWAGRSSASAPNQTGTPAAGGLPQPRPSIDIPDADDDSLGG